ncbi:MULTISPECIES: response regulator [Alteromonas]|uniref:Transcriptional regulator n=1 Tax=Alteromonas macleodii TaxID=28108 RepID=A0A6T9Y210_ALTMA|nr:MULTISPECIES: response regulator [Alteromonas]MCZ8529315.1 response regulator [Alteromonas sp. PRIM-21]CAB9493991.1 Transcriptional regulator [Alteromonas macleodii]
MQFSNKQVLIVEDQRPFLLLLKGLMHSMGASDVVTKSSAEQAVSLCKKHKFDIVICDLHLGADTKNGYELIEELRTRRLINPTSVFILISADSARPVVLGSIERRPDDFLIKPFSQVQLKSRIVRAWQKRQFLQQAFNLIEQGEYNSAIDHIETLLENPRHYKGHCEQLLVELYWRISQPQKALDVLKEYIEGRPVLWAQIAIGRTYLLLNEYEKAISIAKKTLKRNRFNADAHDILAQAHHALDAGEKALDAIREAIKLSPFSLPRHYKACEIGRENDDLVLAANSSQAIWNLSKRTVHKASLHWCTMIRSLLDVAESADDKSQRNKYQQEALLTLQRGKFDEHLYKIDREFDVEIFGNIVNARISAIDGKLIDAKRHLNTSQIQLDDKYAEVPTAFIPDSINVMYKLGEFDDALQLSSLLSSRGEELDQNSSYMLKTQAQNAQKSLASYQQFNREGIQHYQQQDFERAKASFALAQGFAPVNTGVALNLLQCLLQIAIKEDKAEMKLINECKRLFKLIDDMTLKAPYKEKYENIRDELSKYIGF